MTRLTQNLMGGELVACNHWNCTEASTRYFYCQQRHCALGKQLTESTEYGVQSHRLIIT